MPITAQGRWVFALSETFFIFFFAKSVLLFTEVAVMVLFIVNNVSYFEMGATVSTFDI